MALIVSAFAERPLLSMVALAARCARRVLPLARTESDPATREGWPLSLLESMVSVAENFARDGNLVVAVQKLPDLPEPGTSFEDLKEGKRLSRAANAARSCISVYLAALHASNGDVKLTGLAASEAFTYAADAADGIPRDANRMTIDPAFSKDASRLPSARNAWPENERGENVDPGETGPLGPLWPNEVPGWARSSIKISATDSLLLSSSKSSTVVVAATESPVPEIMKKVEKSQPEGLIYACFDDSNFTEEEVELCLSYLSEVYREQGGVGLKVVGERTLVPDEV